MRRVALAAALALLLSPPLVRAETAVWSGRVEIDGAKRFERGSTLTIEPGATVVFKRVDRDGDGWGDASLTLEEGALTVNGTPEKPVVFTSEGPAKPGEWGEIRLDFSKVELRHAIIEGSTRGLHLHFSSGLVADSQLRFNVDATRLGESKVEFLRCLFSHNESKGFNARASTNVVRDSWFRGNKRGIFLFEGDKGSTFTGNLFTGNETPVRLGDFFEGEVTVEGNDWDGGDAPPPDGPAGYLSDPAQKAWLVWKGGKVGRVGPKGWPVFRPDWERPLEGFVDADPAASELGLYAADWSGNLLRLGLFDGKPLASFKAGDVIDAQPALGIVNGKPLVAAQTWGRKVLLLDGATLAKLDEFTEEPSPADDHRQSAPLFSGSRLYVGTWKGKARAFDVSGGKLLPLWTFDAGGPVRGGMLRANHLLLAPSEAGVLTALDENGVPAWSANFDAPLLSSPLVSDGLAFVGDKGGKLTALSLADGKPLWSEQLCGPAWYAPPAGADSRVYQGDDGGCLTAFDEKTGGLIWRVKLDGGIRTRPMAEESLLYVTTLGGSLYMLDAATGLALDRLAFPQPLGSSPAHLGDRIYFGGRDGKIRSIEVVVQP